jgi:hypothetical protein
VLSRQEPVALIERDDAVRCGSLALGCSRCFLGSRPSLNEVPSRLIAALIAGMRKLLTVSETFVAAGHWP